VSPPRACLLSFSRIADDPRVCRQGNALVEDGWVVTSIGLSGAAAEPPPWRVLTSDTEPVPAGGSARRALIAQLAAVRAGLADPLRVYWRLPAVRAMWRALAGVAAEVYLANDWWTLPLAARAAREHGAAYAYDSHEHALTQGAGRWGWRLLFPPFVAAVEGGSIAGAAFVSTVSEGIGALLASQYGLARAPLVTRSMPCYQPVPVRPSGARPAVLYHGLLRPGRSLGVLVRSLAIWRPEFTLSLRGPGQSHYLESLRTEAVRRGVGERLELLPPVPMTELVAAARPFDIGIFCAEGATPQTRFALPNKLFEYIMAGLAVCVSDLPEMRRIVRRYDVGWLVQETTPRDIAEVINGLTPAAIESARAASRRAARDLCWEVERRGLLAAMRVALKHSPGSQA